jgi:hypothetical protein
MARFKDFGGAVDATAEPVKFKLFNEEFICVKQLQGKVLLELVADSGSDDAAKTAAVMTKFFKTVLLDESYERFDALLNDKEKIVPVETLAEITSWLIEEYSDRPTERS